MVMIHELWSNDSINETGFSSRKRSGGTSFGVDTASGRSQYSAGWRNLHGVGPGGRRQKEKN